MIKRTQKDIDIKANEILSNINNSHAFLYKNYKILLKKRRGNTIDDMLLIENCEQESLDFKAPEQIQDFVKTICFYLALEDYNIPF